MASTRTSSVLAAMREVECRRHALLERTALHSTSHSSAVPTSTTSTEPSQNQIWREKVLEWYFAVLRALNEHHSADEASSSSTVPNPYGRASAHLAAALMDGYLLSLPSDSRRRYQRDRRAYQLLATTSLLLGMRLSLHDQNRERKLRREQEQRQEVRCEMKRTKRHEGSLSDMESEPMDSGSSVAESASEPSLSAAALLRISAAPKCITEEDVVQMARRMINSKVFPRTKCVTAVDLIEAFCRSSTTEIAPAVDRTVVVEALRLVDASVRDVGIVGVRPSIIACSVLILALRTSSSVRMDEKDLRQYVCRAIMGKVENPLVQKAVMNVEARLRSARHVQPTSIRDGVNRQSPSHVIPHD